MKYFEVLKENCKIGLLAFLVGLGVSLVFNRDLSHLYHNRAALIGSFLGWVILGPFIAIIKKKFNQD